MPFLRPEALLLAGVLLAGPVAAQAEQPAAAATPAVEAYRREVFTYQRGGRPDPFQPLLSAADLGYRVEDLRLTSIIYSPDPRMSVAVFALADSARRFRLRTGQRLGGITVAAIYPRRVDLRVEDFGVARIESVTLQRPTAAQTPSSGPALDPSSQPVIIQQQPAAPASPAGPLRRGGRGTATADPARGSPRGGAPSSNRER